MRETSTTLTMKYKPPAQGGWLFRGGYMNTLPQIIKAVRYCEGNDWRLFDRQFLLFSAVQDIFIQKTCAEPVRGVIDSDNAVDIIRRAFIIPGTKLSFFQSAPCKKFRGKNTDSIKCAPERNRPFFNKPINRFKECRHTIYRKHPQRSIPFQFKILIFQSISGSKQDLQAPPHQTTSKKILNHN